MPDLKYDVCDCEYPCSCVFFEHRLYGSWKEIIDDLIKQRNTLAERLIDRQSAPTTAVEQRLEAPMREVNVQHVAKTHQPPDITDGN